MNRYTSHSITRCQQRGVKAEVADFVVAYGDFTRTHQDRKFFINKSKLKKLFLNHKEFILKNDKQILSTAVIANGNTIITVMKKINKLKWN
jgi:hypothetical protein